MDETQQTQFSGWAKVEVMGHQTHIGFVRTEAYGQAVMFRIDTPELPEREYVLEEPAYVTEGLGVRQWVRAGAKVKRVARPGCSVLVGAGSIYRIIPCTEDAALKAIDATERAELRLVELPPQQALAEAVEHSGEEVQIIRTSVEHSEEDEEYPPIEGEEENEELA